MITPKDLLPGQDIALFIQLGQLLSKFQCVVRQQNKQQPALFADGTLRERAQWSIQLTDPIRQSVLYGATVYIWKLSESYFEHKLAETRGSNGGCH